MSDDTEWAKIEIFQSSGEHLPEPLKDFHDQKEIFKHMHQNYEDNRGNMFSAPNWAAGHVYIIDWFLWYMAARGYTLQKSRKNIKWAKFEKSNIVPLFPKIEK